MKWVQRTKRISLYVRNYLKYNFNEKKKSNIILNLSKKVKRVSPLVIEVKLKK